MKLLLGLLVLVAGLQVSSAQNIEPLMNNNTINSQRRSPFEDWRLVRDLSRLHHGNIAVMDVDAMSAVDAAVPFPEIDTQQVVAWPKYRDLYEGYYMVRDSKDLNDPDKGEEFKRRLSWLYPDDGCWVRAAMMKHYLAADKKLPAPTRVFIFGNLTVKTENAPDGEVSWWYHTAPVVRIDSEVYVFDPAIDPLGPVPLHWWVKSQVTDVADAELAFCQPSTYAPFSSCNNPPANDDARASSDIKSYLRYEWKRQVKLGRDPKVVLGDKPPWE